MIKNNKKYKSTTKKYIFSIIVLVVSLIMLLYSVRTIYQKIDEKIEWAEMCKDYTITEGTVEEIEAHKHNRHKKGHTVAYYTYSIRVSYIREGTLYTHKTNDIFNSRQEINDIMYVMYNDKNYYSSSAWVVKKDIFTGKYLPYEVADNPEIVSGCLCLMVALLLFSCMLPYIISWFIRSFAILQVAIFSIIRIIVDNKPKFFIIIPIVGIIMGVVWLCNSVCTLLRSKQKSSGIEKGVGQ